MLHLQRPCESQLQNNRNDPTLRSSQVRLIDHGHKWKTPAVLFQPTSPPPRDLVLVLSGDLSANFPAKKLKHSRRSSAPFRQTWKLSTLLRVPNCRWFVGLTSARIRLEYFTNSGISSAVCCCSEKSSISVIAERFRHHFLDFLEHRVKSIVCIKYSILRIFTTMVAYWTDSPTFHENLCLFDTNGGMARKMSYFFAIFYIQIILIAEWGQNQI